MTYSERIGRAENAVQDELNAWTVDQFSGDLRGYVAEIVVCRLIRDGFIPDGVKGEA